MLQRLEATIDGNQIGRQGLSELVIDFLVLLGGLDEQLRQPLT